MRQFYFFAIGLLVAGTVAARYADRAVTAAPPRAEVVEPAADAREPASSGRSITVDADRLGHFQVNARIDGRHLDFLVDTGASLVVLRESDAAMVGIRPQPGDYTATAITANGRIRAARATIDRIELGDITVYDVAAMVLPDEALARNLLGASFLSRLRRFEYANGRLVLEQ